MAAAATGLTSSTRNFAVVSARRKASSRFLRLAMKGARSSAAVRRSAKAEIEMTAGGDGLRAHEARELLRRHLAVAVQ